MITLKKKNFAFSQLASGISDTDTSLTVLTGDGLKFPNNGPFRAVIWGQNYISPENDTGREIVEATISSGDTFTITRAKEGTTAKSWSAGDKIALVLTNETIEEIETEITNHKSATSAHGVSGAVAGTTDTQTLSNKTLDNTNILTIKDANLTIQDDADTTKQAKFQASGITAGQTRTYTLPDANTTLVGTDNPQTITNKRNQKRTSSTTSASSLTPDISQYDLYQFTALAANLTINNPTGSPVLGEVIVILIKDDGTSRTLSFGTAYKAMGQALPTATTAGKRMEIICEYDSSDSSWLTSYTVEQ